VSAALQAVDARGERTRACERLLVLTRSIRDGLESGDWGAAAELEAERRGLVEVIFDGPPPAAELSAITATLREVVRVNDELVGLAEHRRRALEREADTAAVGRAAVRAYAAAGG
jgi:translation initiation factor 2B subunit (eIF-2B alpha/beta/delta family)